MGIHVRNVSKSFGSFRALQDVELNIRPGVLTALLGPSGSGKTTLLRIIAGLERPDPGGGGIHVFDEDVAGRRVQDRRVGFVFQHYALFRHMTVFENVAFGMKVKPRAQRRDKQERSARVHELLRLVQLDSLANRFPAQLSGGQRQRVALARALAVEPKVLLLDEPFGALDAKVRKKLRGWLRRLHHDLNITTVFVTHDQEEALEVADEIVVMNDGRIEQVGSPEDVFHHPSSEFVMGFLGSVNVFHGRLADGMLDFASFRVTAPEDLPRGNAAAKVFIRPHDLEIHPHGSAGKGMPATIHHVHSAGPVVRLELRTPSGDLAIAEISQARHQALGLVAGDTVLVSFRGMRVFTRTGSDGDDVPL